MNVYFTKSFHEDTQLNFYPLRGFKVRLVRFLNKQFSLVNSFPQFTIEGYSDRSDGFPVMTQEGLEIIFDLSDSPLRREVNSTTLFYDALIVYYLNREGEEVAGIIIKDLGTVNGNQMLITQGINTLLLKGFKHPFIRIGEPNFLEPTGVITATTPMRAYTRLYSVLKVLTPINSPEGLSSEFKILNTY